jgi:NADH-ubiquinone oxidoreductase chain 6
VKSKSWDTILVENTHITSIGNILYTSLFILLIVTSLILLLAMVGTIVITIKKSKQNSISNDNMETAKYSNISAL